MIETQGSEKGKTEFSIFVKSLLKSSMGIIGLSLVLLFLVSAVFAPIIAPYAPDDFVGDSLVGPSWAHPIGTDELGDVLVCVAFNVFLDHSPQGYGQTYDYLRHTRLLNCFAQALPPSCLCIYIRAS